MYIRGRRIDRELGVGHLTASVHEDLVTCTGGHASVVAGLAVPAELRCDLREHGSAEDLGCAADGRDACDVGWSVAVIAPVVGLRVSGIWPVSSSRPSTEP